MTEQAIERKYVKNQWFEEKNLWTFRDMSCGIRLQMAGIRFGGKLFMTIEKIEFLSELFWC